MKQLPLTKGKFALVDDEDYYWLAQFNWQAIELDGITYARRNKKKGILKSGQPYEIYLHRVVMQCIDKSLVVDHKDHNGLNCQKENLRICTKAENNRGLSSQKNSSSKYLGVSFSNSEPWREKKWMAQLTFNGQKVLRKRFLTEEEAALAYNQAAATHFKEFANLNIIH